ncbi:MAG: hypothetical protein AAF533_01180 [Acidobacteriota bacterium]
MTINSSQGLRRGTAASSALLVIATLASVVPSAASPTTAADCYIEKMNCVSAANRGRDDCLRSSSIAGTIIAATGLGTLYAGVTAVGNGANPIASSTIILAGFGTTAAGAVLSEGAAFCFERHAQAMDDCIDNHYGCMLGLGREPIEQFQRPSVDIQVALPDMSHYLIDYDELVKNFDMKHFALAYETMGRIREGHGADEFDARVSELLDESGMASAESESDLLETSLTFINLFQKEFGVVTVEDMVELAASF